MCKGHLFSDTLNCLWLVLGVHAVSKQSTIVNSAVVSLVFFTPLLLLCCLLFCSVFITVWSKLSCILCATFLFLPYSDITCDLLLNRCIATWNLFLSR